MSPAAVKRPAARSGMRDMARRLPQLVRRSLALAWRVDRRATVGLLLCQAASGVMQALGLVAISGTLTALLTSGDVYQRLLQAWPSVALLAGAAGVRALLGITVNWLSSRLGPLMTREAEQMLLTGCAEAELRGLRRARLQPRPRGRRPRRPGHRRPDQRGAGPDRLARRPSSPEP